MTELESFHAFRQGGNIHQISSSQPNLIKSSSSMFQLSKQRRRRVGVGILSNLSLPT